MLRFLGRNETHMLGYAELFVILSYVLSGPDRLESLQSINFQNLEVHIFQKFLGSLIRNQSFRLRKSELPNFLISEIESPNSRCLEVSGVSREF